MVVTYGGQLDWFEEEIEVNDGSTDEEINREIKALVRQKVDYWFRREKMDE